jgi:hypothetical protein
MEYSQYGDLENFKKDVIKRAPLSETLICFIHLDIKQQNIVVDD